MKSFVAQVVVVLVLVGAGAVLWSAGEAERELAAAERTLATLGYDRAVEAFGDAAEAHPLRRLLGGAMANPATAAQRQQLAAYWNGGYDQAAAAADPGSRLLAANAAFRAARRDGGPRQTLGRALDDVAKRYADLLRDDPDNLDAAFNYEFVLRFRSAVASTRQPAIPGVDPASGGLTVHGLPGGPPEGGDPRKFRMIVPMRPDERLEAEEAGRTQQRIRKG